jgi:hypothetical protein
MSDVRACALEYCDRAGTVELPTAPYIHPRHGAQDPPPAYFCAEYAGKMRRREFGLAPVAGIVGKPYTHET